MGHGWVPVFGSPCPRLSDTVNNNRIEQWSRSNSPFSRMDWRKTKQAPSFFLFPFVPSPRLLPMGSIHAKYNSGYTSPLATTFLSFAGILASVLKQRIAINSLFWCHVKKKKKTRSCGCGCEHVCVCGWVLRDYTTSFFSLGIAIPFPPFTRPTEKALSSPNSVKNDCAVFSGSTKRVAQKISLQHTSSSRHCFCRWFIVQQREYTAWARGERGTEDGEGEGKNGVGGGAHIRIDR